MGNVKTPNLTGSRLDQLSQFQSHRPDAALMPAQAGESLCVHHLFEQQAVLSPEQPAVVAEERCLSYRELNERANQLAHFLRRQGVGPNVLVGLSVERSWEMVVGILGILKAGGAYVPLDPAYPQDRLSYMLRNSQAQLLLTQQKLAEKFTTLGTPVFCLDTQWAELGGESRENPVTSVRPQDLLYVIYTSGSTGQPKGAGVYHRGFTNLLRWYVTDFGLNASDRILLVSSFSFDLTQKNIYAPLLQGGQLQLLPSGPYDPARLQHWIEQHASTLINCTPSAFYPLLEPAGPGTWQKLSSLRWVVLGGEPISIPRVRSWLESETCRAEIANTYGPTECTDIALFYRMNRANMDKYSFVPLGRAIPNVQVVILDENLAPCPPGVSGELCIGGIGVGAGYLQDPERSGAKFVPNSFPEITSARFYKTGDLARLLPEGHFEFLGRMDHQVKIRGFRIELQEIEQALASHPAIQEAVVIVRDKGTPGSAASGAERAALEPRLVAYYQLKSGQTAAVGELREFLKQKLPDYMVPALFVCLKQFPLSPNGKVDRRALPEPDEPRAPAPGTDEAPANAMESRIAEIWREVLNLKQVGLEDNFFEVGGDSLLLAQMISRLREAFQVELPVARVFETPTIAALAKTLGSSQRAQEGHGAPPPLTPVARNGTAPLSFIQRQFWFLGHLEPGHPASHIPAAIRVEAKMDPVALQRSLEEITCRHEILRSTFPSINGEPLQVISSEPKVHLEQLDLSGVPSAEREQETKRILREHASRPFDLEHGPLVRWLLVRLREQAHILAVTMHHIVSDGWTLGVLFRELDLLYGAFSTNTAAPALPRLAVQYADYACWQLEWLRGPVLEGQLAYWKEKLDGAFFTLDLPLDRTHTDTPSAAGMESIVLPQPLVEQMLAFCRREGITPFTLWLAALALTLHRWTEQSDLVIGTVMAGRNRKETENLVGCFVNFLPLRVQCAPNQSARDFLAQVQRTALEAQAHQDCPFEKIIQAINPKRRPGQTPLYNVAFLLQNYPALQSNYAGLKARPVPFSVPAAQIDLRFVAEEIAGQTTLACEYRTGLFEQSTIQHLLAGFQGILQSYVEALTTALGQFKLSPELAAQATAARAGQNQETVAVAATFTAEPLADSLKYWFKELDMPAQIEFAVFNQVFQELLDPGSLLGSNRRGLNLVLLRWDDWQQRHQDLATRQRQLERNAQDFIRAIRAASSRTSVPWLVCICPPAVLPGTPEERTLYTRLEARLADALNALHSVYLVSHAEVERLYPVGEYADPSAEALGQIPYTSAYFAALGTMVARKFHALSRPPFKVIALDCDGTLWGGICGEEGHQVLLDAPRKALQEFMRAQMEAGMLLCLCSKNDEEDVLTVFRKRPDMPLRLDHLAGWRINWQSKSENLKALAAELGLGLESFIFIDDNPVECAEVEANCPEVLTLQLPSDPALLPQFLQHCWAFDHLKVSAEDRQRSALYRQERERQKSQARSSSLGDFLAGLGLKVEIVDLEETQLARAAQLTQRTNQFNFTTRRRNETELVTLHQEDWTIATVSVSDRFGQYGLTGLMIWKPAAQALEVETFLVSCRVLGRGVEHEMVAHLGNIALRHGLSHVKLHFQTSAKNQPALQFLQKIAGAPQQAVPGDSHFVYLLPANRAAALRFNPESGPPAPGRNEARESVAAKSQRNTLPAQRKFSQCQRIALESADPNRVLQALGQKLPQPTGLQESYVVPRTEIEKVLCQIWAEGLRLERVGIKDNFFALGGTSLLAVCLFARVEKQLGRKLPLVTLFKAPTIEHLAELLARESGTDSSLVAIQPQGTKPPLFLVHGAGGDLIWGYANLAPHLGPEQPVYGLSSQASAPADEAATLEQMAARYVEGVQQLQPHGPYYLGGYCFGGNVAYEMARQLHAQGEPIALVALLDCAPANCGYERMPWWQPGFAFRFVRNCAYWLADFARLEPAERAELIRRKARTWGRKLLQKIRRQPSANVDLEEVINLSHFEEKQLRLWQLHLDALDRHVTRPFAGRVTLFRTRGQPLFCSLQADFGWGKLAQGGVDVRLVPGAHESIFIEPAVQALAKELKETIAEASGQKAALGHEVAPGEASVAS